MKRFEAIKSILANSGHFYLLTTDLQGKYTYINSNYSNALSHLGNEIIGQCYTVSMHPEDVALVQKTCHSCISEPDKLFTAMLRKHDGKGGFMYTQWEFSAIKDEISLEIYGICCLGYNITNAIDEQNRLIESNNLLAEQKAALKSISYIQSHVIRKPVANIQGLALLLSGMEIDASLQNICTMILDSSNELDGVIREVVGHVNGHRSGVSLVANSYQSY